MIHIAPWAAGMAVIRGAAAVLGPGGLLFLYGPFRRGGQARLTDIFLPKEETAAMISGYDAPDRRELGYRRRTS
jgi:Protein of unknown function (DUF938)